MIFSASKCPLPALVAWCRTLKHSLGAGLNPVRIFRQLAKSGPRPLREVASEFAGRLEKGESLEDVLDSHRDRFPSLFVELVGVGEQTGRLEATFDELERYYETTLSVQRDFRSQMAYPAIQFVAAVLIISALIFVLGMLGKNSDPIGLGLTGTSGAMTFLFGAFGIAGAILFVFKMTANSVQWRAKIEGMGLMLPSWGPALLAFALHRFSVALMMTTEAGLRAEKGLRFSFRATANSAFLRGEKAAVTVVKRGGEIHEALAASGAPFPEDFRQSLLVAEVSGRMTEVTERLAENYREEAARRLKSAAQFTSYAIYAGMAVLLIIAIFRIAGVYLGAIGDATRGM